MELAGPRSQIDGEINRLEMEIDELCLRVLARRQPSRAICGSSPSR